MSEPSTERGAVTWFTSEQGGAPDCGLLLGLGGGKSLYVGEVANSTLEGHGIDMAKTGDGWWIVLYGEGDAETIVGRVIGDSYDAQEMIDALSAALREKISKEMG